MSRTILIHPAQAVGVFLLVLITLAFSRGVSYDIVMFVCIVSSFMFIYIPWQINQK